MKIELTKQEYDVLIRFMKHQYDFNKKHVSGSFPQFSHEIEIYKNLLYKLINKQP